MLFPVSDVVHAAAVLAGADPVPDPVQHCAFEYDAIARKRVVTINLCKQKSSSQDGELHQMLGGSDWTCISWLFEKIPGSW
jgi:hypothetical protein